MTLDSLFRLSAYGLIGSGFAALAVTGGLDAVSVLLYSAAFLASWFVDPRRLNARYPGWSVWAFHAYLIFYVLDLVFLSGDFLMATVHLVLYTSALKLFSLKSDRDYVFLFLISFTELVAASTLTLSISFLVTLSLFLLASVSTLILLEIRRSMAESQRSVEIQQTGARTGFTLEVTRRFHMPAFFGTSLALTVLTLVMAVPVFFLLPRLQSSFLSRNPGDTAVLSGFSEHVLLGELGSIKRNNSVVMRVRVDAPAGEVPQDMKWRGIALDRYDGRSWSQSQPDRRPLGGSGRPYFELSQEPYRGKLLAQTVFLQPVNTEVLFALHRPTALAQDTREPRQVFYRDRFGSILRERQGGTKIRYTVWSDLHRPLPQRLREAPIPLPTAAPIVQAYFQVPQLDPRIPALAETLTRGLSNSYDKARRIEQYLNSSFGYTLDMPPVRPGDDPLAVFLFETRAGHCEYFASAMAMLLRCAGIPSRIVNGFQLGEYNELGDDYIVRQSNAHTWVEVFFPGESWVEFDPTPPDPGAGRNMAVSWIGKVIDAAELYWEEHVIRYNLWRQVQLFAGVRNAILATTAGINGWVRTARRTVEDRLLSWGSRPGEAGSWEMGAWLFAAAALMLLGFGARRRVRLWYWRLRGRQERVKRALAMEFYASMLELLRRYGHVKPASATALEFAESLRGSEAFPSVHALTEIYHRLRFRGDAASDTSLADARQHLRRLRAQLAGRSD